jgi:glyoxylase-like metal-dependent hydrolase (beta-lactamase superfamily II)
VRDSLILQASQLPPVSRTSIRKGAREEWSKASDIGRIIHTHVHLGHAGQDLLFSNAKIDL